MLRRILFVLIFAAVASAQAAKPPAGPVEIVFRHALSGEEATCIAAIRVTPKR